MPAMVETVAPARPARAAGTPVRRPAGGDLILIEPTDPGRIRRVLRELDCVHAVVIAGGVCRVWVAAGSAGRVVEALAGAGLTLTVLTLRWRPERPRETVRPSSPGIVAGLAARLGRTTGDGPLTRLIVVTAAPGPE